MLGVIVWIRGDGRAALVALDGASALASGDPGRNPGANLKAGDLVHVSGLAQGDEIYDQGLSLVQPDFWPAIARDLQKLSRSGRLAKTLSNRDPVAGGSNVVTLFPRGKGPVEPRKRMASARD